jgi:cation:H+ antiporter
LNDYLILFLGIAAAGFGGEMFVRGAVGLAKWARIPAGIIGATIAAFATSSPELAIAINASIDGTPQIALGDALGANVVNVSLILGIALLISVIKVPRDIIVRDMRVAIAAPFVLGVLIIDGELSRINGLILLTIFLGWLVAVVRHIRTRRSERAVEMRGEHRHWLTIIWIVVGLGSLILAGELVVTGAKGIALAFGLDEFVIGATIVAIGTTMPELATVVISKIRGHEEIGLGTILGSNIFNNFWVVSVATLISPMKDLPLKEVFVGLGFGAIAVLLTYPGSSGVIGRKRGIVLVILYAAYLVIMFRQ